MTADPRDLSRDDAYLWDPSTPPSPAVEDLEQRLAAARFDARRPALDLPAPQGASPSISQPRPSRRMTLAWAAGLMLAVATAGGAYWSWRWAWRDGAPWPLQLQSTTAATATAPASVLPPDERLQVGTTDLARMQIARIGTLVAQPGTTLTITRTSSARHRVTLDRGTVNVRVWAPPGRLGFDTPAGSIIDLGCIFELNVANDGSAHLHVDTGWVQMVNSHGEQLVPAGASSSMSPTAGPLTPLFDDAAPEFKTGVRALETATDPDGKRALTEVVTARSRARDVLTLLMLTRHVDAEVARPLLERAAVLHPPPVGVTVDGVLANREGLWVWYGTLDLPPAKNWWRNWRDALPGWR